MALPVNIDDRPNIQADVADLKVNLIADYLHEIGSGLYPAAEEMSPLEVGSCPNSDSTWRDKGDVCISER